MTSLLTEWDATVATFSSIMGAAILATPYASALCGLFGIPLIILFTTLSMYTAHLMAYTLIDLTGEADKLGIPRGLRNWSFLTDTAFGEKAKQTITGFLFVELWGYVLCYTVVFAVHLNTALPRISVAQGIAISSVLTFILTFASPTLLTKV